MGTSVILANRRSRRSRAQLARPSEPDKLLEMRPQGACRERATGDAQTEVQLQRETRLKATRTLCGARRSEGRRGPGRLGGLGPVGFSAESSAWEPGQHADARHARHANARANEH